eukprot:6481604-Prymnesium_polylepis.1
MLHTSFFTDFASSPGARRPAIFRALSATHAPHRPVALTAQSATPFNASHSAHIPQDRPHKRGANY